MNRGDAARSASGLTLIEVMMAMGLLGVFGIAVYSMLNIGMILGAKNTAVNSAHQQARTAMLQMVQDLHSAVSLPALTDVNHAFLANPAPNTAAPGIAFQLWSAGPYQVCADSDAGSSTINVQVPAGGRIPVVGQRVIVQGHRVEEDITAVTDVGGGVFRLTLAHPLVHDIAGTGTPTFYNISCFLTDRCSYTVTNGALQWDGPTTRKSFVVLGNDIISPTPFTTPNTPAGALYYRFVAAINLCTSDEKYDKRGFKSANILLNGQVPTRARLTDYQ
jgi:prepilin-type N-terminal cleavage/methylation domain-containing protein